MTRRGFKTHLSMYLSESELVESTSIAELTNMLKTTVGATIGREVDSIIEKHSKEVASKLRTWAMNHSSLIGKTTDERLSTMIEKIMNNSLGVAKQPISNFIKTTAIKC